MFSISKFANTNTANYPRNYTCYGPRATPLESFLHAWIAPHGELREGRHKGTLLLKSNIRHPEYYKIGSFFGHQPDHSTPDLMTSHRMSIDMIFKNIFLH